MVDTRHGVFGVGPQLVAIHARDLQEMFVLPEVRRPPGCPPWQRGLVSMRGTVLPALDLRLRLGLPTAQAELQALEKMLGVSATSARTLAAAAWVLGDPRAERLIDGAMEARLRSGNGAAVLAPPPLR